MRKHISALLAMVIALLFLTNCTDEEIHAEPIICKYTEAIVQEEPGPKPETITPEIPIAYDYIPPAIYKEPDPTPEPTSKPEAAIPDTPTEYNYIPTITPEEPSPTPEPEATESPQYIYSIRAPKIISPHQAEEMMLTPSVIILDVRTQSEFDSGHIENAILLPYDEIAALAAAIFSDKNQTILIYCQAGRRSNIAAWALADLGFTAVYDFGGIRDWHGPITYP